LIRAKEDFQQQWQDPALFPYQIPCREYPDNYNEDRAQRKKTYEKHSHHLLLISFLTLAPKAFAEERWRIYDQKGRYEGTVRLQDDGHTKMYDQKGRHERTFVRIMAGV